MVNRNIFNNSWFSPNEAKVPLLNRTGRAFGYVERFLYLNVDCRSFS